MAHDWSQSQCIWFRRLVFSLSLSLVYLCIMSMIALCDRMIIRTQVLKQVWVGSSLRSCKGFRRFPVKRSREALLWWKLIWVLRKDAKGWCCCWQDGMMTVRSIIRYSLIESQLHSLTMFNMCERFFFPFCSFLFPTLVASEKHTSLYSVIRLWELCERHTSLFGGDTALYVLWPC